MKRLIQISAVIFSVLFVAGIASAATYTYGDAFNEWPGYKSINGHAGDDVVGSGPAISGATVVTRANGRLQSISFYVSEESDFRLFINTNWTAGENYDAWNLYAQGHVYSSLYQITGQYQYLTAQFDTQRQGHPSGIDIAKTGSNASLLAEGNNNGIFSVTYDAVNGAWIYNFADNPLFLLGDSFVIGFTSYCANDVFLNVPEPATMLLLGLGLVGIAAIRRKIK